MAWQPTGYYVYITSISINCIDICEAINMNLTKVPDPEVTDCRFEPTVWTPCCDLAQDVYASLSLSQVI